MAEPTGRPSGQAEETRLKIISNIHPARLMAAAEAIVALIAAFLPLSGQQVATILGVVAVLTGEQVVRKVRAS